MITSTVLSYSLYVNGLLPHIAAGDNLNLPLLGRLLRQGGAFFMRRSFRSPLYTSVFEEYFRVLSNGYSVEFFPKAVEAEAVVVDPEIWSARCVWRISGVVCQPRLRANLLRL